MKPGVLSRVIGVLVMGVLWSGFPSVSLCKDSDRLPGQSFALQPRIAQSEVVLSESQEIGFQLVAAILEIQQIEPAYRDALIQVKQATRQIKSLLPMTLEASESFKLKLGDLVAGLGMKKALLKENSLNLRFDLITLKHIAPNFERVLESKRSFMVLRE